MIKPRSPQDIVQYTHQPENNTLKNIPCSSNQTGQIQKKEEEIVDWDGNLQEQKELNEQEHKDNKITPHSSPESTFTSTSDTEVTETLTPQPTLKDRCGNPISVTVQEEGQKENSSAGNMEDNSEDSLDDID